MGDFREMKIGDFINVHEFFWDFYWKIVSK